MRKRVIDGYEFVHGESLTCIFDGDKMVTDAVISINDEDDVFICSNYGFLDGSVTTGDMFKYKYSWCISNGLETNYIKNFSSESNRVYFHGYLFTHGAYVTCKIEGRSISDARIVLEDDNIYICQNEKYGTIPDFTFGYTAGWILITGISSEDVTDLVFTTEYISGEMQFGGIDDVTRTDKKTKNKRNIPPSIITKPRNIRKVIMTRVVPGI